MGVRFDGEERVGHAGRGRGEQRSEVSSEKQ